MAVLIRGLGIGDEDITLKKGLVKNTNGLLFMSY